MGHDDNEHPAILQNKIVYGPTVFPPSQAIEPDAQDLITRVSFLPHISLIICYVSSSVSSEIPCYD